MSLYTFFLEFDGGTYITQARGKNLKKAVYKYARKILKHDDLPGVMISQSILEEMKNSEPTRLHRLEGVWVITPTAGGRMIFINIIKTKEPLEE